MVPTDGGPIYAETRAAPEDAGFPVEPWNTASNLIFLAIALHFAWKARRLGRAGLTLCAAAAVLLIGFIGGIAYHGLRSVAFWLYLDFVPIVVLCLGAAFLFWVRVTGRPLWGVLAFGAVVLGLGLPFQTLQDRFPAFSSGAYVVLAVSLLVPVFLDGRRRGFAHGGWVLLALGVFGAALAARELDAFAVRNGLTMGTHFLWHLLGGTSTFALFEYVRRTTAS